MAFFETSSKSGKNINEVFEYMIKEILDNNLDLRTNQLDSMITNQTFLEKVEKKKTKCC